MSAALALSIDDLNAGAVVRQHHVPNQLLRNRSNSLHKFTPSLVPSTWSEAEEVSQATTDRINPERAPIDEIDEREFGKLFREALEADHGNLKSKNKTIAKKAGATSHKTAEAWTQGHSMPGFFKGLKLAAHTPSLKREVVRLMAAEAAFDPEFQALLTRFLQMVGR